MYCNKKLKLNKFEYVAIPSNRDMFSRFGENLPRGACYTGDDVLPIGMTKMDELHEANQFDMYEAYKESLNNAEKNPAE